VNTPNIEIVQN